MNLTQHIAQFHNCVACSLGAVCLPGKNLRVYYSGPTTCEVLFVGEASGESEIDLAEPFVGPPGKLLRMLIDAAMPNRKIGFTNSVICPPQDSPIGKLRTPKKSEINACTPRLSSLCGIVKPKVIVAVGNCGEHALKKLSLPYVKIVHPAYILRKDDEGSGEMLRKQVLLTLQQLNKDYGQKDQQKTYPRKIR